MSNSQDENGPSASSGTRVPRRLGGFELIEQIGRGGMGSVFKAHQVDLDRPVAVKVLSPRLARNKEFVEQFLREARAAGRLNHRSIVAAIDVGECEGFYYFAMEYVDGETLAQLIKREGPLPEDRAIQIVAEVAEALEAARHRGLIHRDIKPDNIMISRDGRVRVTDFGLAKLIDAEGSSPGDSRFLGTPAFMAPEQVRSEPDIDCRADIFSLGVTFYQMLTGKLPFTGGNTVAIAAAVITEPLPSIRKLRPDASLAVCRVVEKMTAKNRDDRYATPADVPTALEAAAAPKLRGRQAAVRPSGPARRVAPRRRKAPVGTYVFIGVAIAALLGILIVLLSQPPSRPRPQPKAPPTVAPSTVASPTTRTPSVAKPGERLFERLQAAVADAERYAADHPKSYASQIRKYRSIMDGFPPNQQVYLPREGLDLIEGIGKAIKRIREQARQSGLAELKEREQRAQALLKAGKVADAIRLLDTFPAELQNETVEAGLAALRRDTYDHIEKLYRALTAQAKALAEKKQFAKAKAVLATVAAWRIPEFTERAKAAAEGIDDLEAQQDDEAAAKARLAFPKHGLAIMARLAAREYAEAEGLIAKALVDPELKAVSDKFRDLQTILRACRDVLSRAGIGAKMYKPGQVVRVAGVAGQFVRVHDGKIYLRVSAGTGAEADTAVVAKTLGELKTAEMVGLAATGYGDNKQQAMSAIALFILAEGNAAAARQGLDAAVAKGLDVAAARDLVDRY
ncbi:protein kinase, partial [bacterium]|nr:protein kinase [bacterium]